MTPDFLIIPFEIKTNTKLRPTDGDIYGIVYWLEHLKEGRCTAGNEYIASILNITERAVRAGLERMEKEGYLQRFFLDPERKNRMEIKTLMKFSKIPPVGQQGLPGLPEEKKETPGQFAKRFFIEGDEGRKAKMEMLEMIVQSSPSANREAIIEAMKEFIVYWTEPNKSGTKQRWQLQQTFDVKRRIYTWLKNSKKYSHAPRAGAGTEI